MRPLSRAGKYAALVKGGKIMQLVSRAGESCNSCQGRENLAALSVSRTGKHASSVDPGKAWNLCLTRHIISATCTKGHVT